MAGPEKFNIQEAYLVRAASARAKAESATDPRFKQLWDEIAHHWESLAGLKGERCACGQPAIGAKYYEDGSRIPYCNTHMTRVIAQEMLIRIGTKKPN